MIKKAALLVLLLTATICHISFGHSVISNLQYTTSKSEVTSDTSFADTSGTFRNQPLDFTYQQETIALPYSLSLYEFERNLLLEISARKPKAELVLETRIDAANNLFLNAKRQVAWLAESDIVKQKSREDSIMKAKIALDTAFSSKYGNLFNNMDQVYKEINMDLKRRIWLDNVYRSTTLLRVSKYLNNFKASLMHQPKANKQGFFDAHVIQLKDSLKNEYATFDVDADREMLRKMIGDAATFSLNQRISAIQKIVSRQNGTREGLDRFINDTFGLSRLKDSNYVLNNILKSPASIANYNDALLNFEDDITEQKVQLQKTEAQRDVLLKQYLANYISLKTILIPAKAE